MLRHSISDLRRIRKEVRPTLWVALLLAALVITPHTASAASSHALQLLQPQIAETSTPDPAAPPTIIVVEASPTGLPTFTAVPTEVPTRLIAPSTDTPTSEPSATEVPIAATPSYTPAPLEPSTATALPHDVPFLAATYTPVETGTATPTPTTAFTATPTPSTTSTDTVTPTPSAATATITQTSTPTPDPACFMKPGKTVLKLNLPYIHQVNDVNNANGSWACGSASLAMTLAYYGKLEPWPVYEARNATATTAAGTTVAQSTQVRPSPSTSLSPSMTVRPTRTRTATPVAAAKGSVFAPYVSNAYTNNGRTYSSTARDPRGNPVAGLYGTISPTGFADWSIMMSVLESHGLSGKRIPVSFESVVAALKRGRPVLIGNRLTPEGHILVAVGYTDKGQLIVNDPYGNRFAPGYGGNNGNEVTYLWKCLTAHTAVEVIGIYPPPTHTPTVTPSPTATSSPSPSPPSTSTDDASGSPRPRVGQTRVTPPVDPSPLDKALADSSNSLYHGRA